MPKHPTRFSPLEAIEKAITEDHPDQLLTVDQAARLLAVTPRTIWQMGRDGRLGRVLLGTKTIRYPLAEVRRLIRERYDRRD